MSQKLFGNAAVSKTKNALPGRQLDLFKRLVPKGVEIIRAITVDLTEKMLAAQRGQNRLENIRKRRFADAPFAIDNDVAAQMADAVYNFTNLCNPSGKKLLVCNGCRWP